MDTCKVSIRVVVTCLSSCSMRRRRAHTTLGCTGVMGVMTAVRETGHQTRQRRHQTNQARIIKTAYRMEASRGGGAPDTYRAISSRGSAAVKVRSSGALRRWQVSDPNATPSEALVQAVKGFETRKQRRIEPQLAGSPCPRP